MNKLKKSMHKIGGNFVWGDLKNVDLFLIFNFIQFFLMDNCFYNLINSINMIFRIKNREKKYSKLNGGLIYTCKVRIPFAIGLIMN